MPSTSHIEIIRNALKNNVAFIKSILDKKTIISAVIKGNAYGHGVHVVVTKLEEFGINHFSVYSSPEAKNAFKFISNKSTIMIMSFIYDDDL